MLRFLLLITLAVTTVGACSNATASPSAPRATSPAIPSPSAPASVSAPVGSAPAPSTTVVPASVGPSAQTSGIADLASLLPSSVGGHGLQRSQFSGAQFAGSGAVNQQMKDLLTSLGRTVADMTMAIAADPAATTDLNITAFRVRDISAETFLKGYLPLLAQAYGNGSISQGTRAGKPIYTVVPTQGTAAQVLVPRDDVLFVVISADDALVDEAVALLP